MVMCPNEWKIFSSGTKKKQTNNQTKIEGFFFYQSLFSFFAVLQLSQCYRPRECFPPPCARPPENCRQEFVYEYVNGQKCPVACRLVCECPQPSQQSLEFCKNTDPFCFAQKDFIELPNGKRCFNGCILACQGAPSGQ